LAFDRNVPSTVPSMRLDLPTLLNLIRPRNQLAVLLAACQLLAAIGIPLPTAPGVKDTSKPYPCMNHACGCLSAEQCWSSCCCYTMQEKLAWAEANNVEPPAFVREAAVREQEIEATDSAGACPCCRCCKTPVAHGDCDACTPDKSEAPTCAEHESRWVLVMLAARCQGQGPLGLLGRVPSLPAAAPFILVIFLEALDDICLGLGRCEPIAHAPPVPPPRCR
jgi:hypothetical protein